MAWTDFKVDQRTCKSVMLFAEQPVVNFTIIFKITQTLHSRLTTDLGMYGYFTCQSSNNVGRLMHSSLCSQFSSSCTFVDLDVLQVFTAASGHMMAKLRSNNPRQHHSCDRRLLIRHLELLDGHQRRLERRALAVGPQTRDVCATLVESSRR